MCKILSKIQDKNPDIFLNDNLLEIVDKFLLDFLLDCVWENMFKDEETKEKIIDRIANEIIVNTESYVDFVKSKQN